MQSKYELSLALNGSKQFWFHRSFQHTATFETCIADFHKVLKQVLKTTKQKTGSMVTKYRDYHRFSEETFKQKLKEELDSIETADLEDISFKMALSSCILLYIAM